MTYRDPNFHIRNVQHLDIHSFIIIQPLRPGWQEPELSHVTGMALAHRIPDKFYGGSLPLLSPHLDITKVLFIHQLMC